MERLTEEFIIEYTYNSNAIEGNTLTLRKIKYGDCGSWYGSKVWRSNDKYRRVIWQCNHKFDGGEKYCIPHLDEVGNAIAEEDIRFTFKDGTEIKV